MTKTLTRTKTQQVTDRWTKLQSLQRAVAPRGKVDSDKVLLLDVSGSMGTPLANGNQRRIDALRTEIAEFLGKVPAYEFSNGAYKITTTDPSEISEPWGCTHLAEALLELAELGYKNLIVVTDGRPNNKGRALSVARQYSLTCDVIYIGDPPQPPFIAELANATGGSHGSVELGYKELTTRVRGLLTSGTEVIKL